MKYEMIQLRKSGFELDFIKNEDGNQFTCATNFANKCGMNIQSVNRIINTDEILRDASTKLSMRDTKNRNQKMVFIHSDHFLYFLSLVKGVKVAAVAPNFVRNLIIMYPQFLKELQRRASFLLERAEKNHVAQIRLNKMERLRGLLTAEITQLRKDISVRNVEDVIFNQYPDGSVQPTLELEDQFYRNVVEIEAEFVND